MTPECLIKGKYVKRDRIITKFYTIFLNHEYLSTTFVSFYFNRGKSFYYFYISSHVVRTLQVYKNGESITSTPYDNISSDRFVREDLKHQSVVRFLHPRTRRPVDWRKRRFLVGGRPPHP